MAFRAATFGTKGFFFGIVLYCASARVLGDEGREWDLDWVFGLLDSKMTMNGNIFYQIKNVTNPNLY